MKTIELQGNWNDRKCKLKQKFCFLTDNDMMFETDTKEEILGKLQVKLGKTREELLRIIGAL